MADYDRRQNNRGGNRKRRYRDDDDYDRRPQRRRYEEPAHVKVRKRLLSIAESSFSDVGDDIQELGRLVCDERSNDEVQSVFRDVLVRLIQEQPLKIPFVAAIVLVINTHESELAGQVLATVGRAVESSIAVGAWREVKLMLRFLACLQGILEGEGVFPLLEELFSRVVDLQTASSEDGMGLELVKIILLTVAYTMASSAEGFQDRAAALLEKADIVASKPHALEALVNPYSADPESPAVANVISHLSTQLQAEAKKGWPLECIPRPWKSGSATEGLEGTAKHTLHAIQVPETVIPVSRPCLPEVYISLYSEQDLETVPTTDNPASSIVRDAIVDTIDILHFNRNAAAQLLIDIDRYFPPGTFAKRATPFDKLKELESGSSTWKPEDVAVDAVFSQLLKLPMPTHKLVYYHALLTEVCKLAPAAVAPSLGRAIRCLYKSLEVMDQELNHRFLDWFSHHLSNFGFTWKWTEWIDDVDLPPTNAKKSFIIGALDKEIRLSFAQRIRGTLPEAYQVLVPPEKEKDTPDFKFDDEGEPYAAEAREICRLIRTKAPDSELEATMVAIQDAALGQGVVDPLVTSADVLATCLCHVGSKSLSHVLSCIERTKERLLAIGPASPAARRQVAASVLAYWAQRPGTAVAVIDKLLNYSVLTPLSVLELVFAPARLGAGAELAEPHVFELVDRVLSKVASRLRALVTARVAAGREVGSEGGDAMEDSADGSGNSDDAKKGESGANGEQETQQSPAARLHELKRTLDREATHMRQLFALADDALAAVADGSADAALEEADPDPDRARALRRWGAAWLRVFRRKAAVETSWMTETLAAPPPPEPQPSAQKTTGAQAAKAEGTAENGAPEAAAAAAERADLEMAT